LAYVNKTGVKVRWVSVPITDTQLERRRMVWLKENGSNQIKKQPALKTQNRLLDSSMPY
jgi:hypothetical protein